ncbi:hypothetical protein A9Q96_04075 [Rhodobacterales bacterium 52_120_T64]|nr:hypothetical protein A9Q96_04075 [Rhodobacterales bacterium 52_120_T64]
MASVVQNLIYRVSVSAIVGAIVAGGLIYLNNDRVVRSYRAELSAQTEQQDLANKALMEATENLAAAISAIKTAQAQQLTDLNEALSALETKIDAIPVAEATDYSDLTAEIGALNANLSAKLEAMVPAAQEQY